MTTCGNDRDTILGDVQHEFADIYVCHTANSSMFQECDERSYALSIDVVCATRIVLNDQPVIKAFRQSFVEP